MDTLDRVEVDIAVVLGETRMPVHQLLRMGRGAVIELGTRESDDVLLLANDIPIARAQVHVDQGKIAVSITRMLPRPVELRPRSG
jgi:flagellar motor switch protein FliN/FliY